MSYVYITEENAKLGKRGGRYVLARNMEVVMEIPEEVIESLVLVGRVQVTTEAITGLMEKNIPVTWISDHGRFIGRMENTLNVDVFRQQQQILKQGSSLYFQLAERMIDAKANNQLVILRRYNRRANVSSVHSDIANIISFRKHVLHSKSIEQLMGFEGIIAKIYFGALGNLVPPEFEFSKRSKRPPRDPFNSMLSFGYTLLTYELYTAIANHGLSPYFGVMHALKNHHPALASDMVEEWRAPIVDSMVMAMVQHREIKLEHFIKVPDGPRYYLTREGRNIFIHAYEKKMRTVNQYSDSECSYRESINRQVGKLSRAIMENNPKLYEPIRLR